MYKKYNSWNVQTFIDKNMMYNVLIIYYISSVTYINNNERCQEYACEGEAHQDHPHLRNNYRIRVPEETNKKWPRAH